MADLSSKGQFGIDVWMLKELGCQSLIRTLTELPGEKDLIIDSSLMKLLDRLAQATTLRKHKVEKIYRLESLPPTINCSQRAYLVRPTGENIKLIIEHCQHQQQLEKQLSLQSQPSANTQPKLKDAFVDGDLSACAGIAESLQQLLSLYGRPHNVLAHGRAARTVIDALTVFDSQVVTTLNAKRSKLDSLYVLDRDFDLVTPLLTQLTYEGSIDEFYGISASVAELPKQDGSQDMAKVMLNSKDVVFDLIRHKHFAGVAGHLVRRAKEINTKKEESKVMTTAQMKDFVAYELKDLQTQQSSIALHLSVCEAITKSTRRDFEAQLTTEHGLITGVTTASEAKAFFEDCCARQVPLTDCLRLLCLISLTQATGLSPKEYEHLSSQLVAAGGYRHLITLFDLRQAGLLVISDPSVITPQALAMKGLRQALSSKDPGGGWRQITKTLKLIPHPDEVIDLHCPSHMSYVFNGAYTPAIPSLVSACARRGCSHPQVLEALRSAPGKTFTEGWQAEEGAPLPLPVVIVLILGGVTFSELAAFKLLGDTIGKRFIVAATGTITGSKLISSITSSAVGAPS